MPFHTRRVVPLALTAAVMLGSVAHADHERAQLWNDCKPIGLVVEELTDDAIGISLLEEDIEFIARRFLREADLYTEDVEASSWAFLYIAINVVGPAVSTNVEYKKSVLDFATETPIMATTWRVGSTGLHNDSVMLVLHTVTENLQEFIGEYRRANSAACERRRR